MCVRIPRRGCAASQTDSDTPEIGDQGYRAGNRAQQAGTACDAHRMQRARASTLTLDSPLNHSLFVSLASPLTRLPPLTASHPPQEELPLLRAAHRLIYRIRRFVNGDASHRTRLLVKALLGCGMGPTLFGCGRCARVWVTQRLWGAWCPRAVLACICDVGDLINAIPILEGKNASTHFPSIASRPFRLYVVNISISTAACAVRIPPARCACSYRDGSLGGLKEPLGRLDTWVWARRMKGLDGSLSTSLGVCATHLSLSHSATYWSCRAFDGRDGYDTAQLWVPAAGECGECVQEEDMRRVECECARGMLI
ncbi:hypothetical protein B0H13DRAFT_1858493 [Mycena leptocephala]|nr:hypothetical protein B0H13DRAFT_1858493 [Mycena leptocephala]